MRRGVLEFLVDEGIVIPAGLTHNEVFKVGIARLIIAVKPQALVLRKRSLEIGVLWFPPPCMKSEALLEALAATFAALRLGFNEICPCIPVSKRGWSRQTVSLLAPACQSLVSLLSKSGLLSLLSGPVGD